MGNILSAAEQSASVARISAAVVACKATLGLDAHAPYPLPPAYRGECDNLELELKKSLAFALDPANAAILYDPKSPRRAKVQANQVMYTASVCAPLFLFLSLCRV